MVVFNPELEKGEGHTFLKVITPKVKIIERLEFELAYYDVTVRHVSHNTTGTPMFLIVCVSVCLCVCVYVCVCVCVCVCMNKIYPWSDFLYLFYRKLGDTVHLLTTRDVETDKDNDKILIQQTIPVCQSDLQIFQMINTIISLESVHLANIHKSKDLEKVSRKRKIHYPTRKAKTLLKLYTKNAVDKV